MVSYHGSVLDLFYVFVINDLSCSMDYQSFIYTDDTMFCNNNCDIQNLRSYNWKHSAWSKIHQLLREYGLERFLLNENTTQQIYFILWDIPKDYCVSSVKFLAVFIDCRLSCDHHINFISGKLSRVIFLMRQLTNHVSDNYV